MSPRTFVARGAALLALASLGLAACESKTVIPPTPPPPLVIAVTPSSLSFTAAGQKSQVVASLTGGDTGQAAQGVTWSSSNSAVATVDQTGMVTAVANGTTTIIATSKALSTVIGAASVVVNIPPVVKPDTTKPAPPSVSIASITKQNGDQVDLNNVQGTIYVTLNVDVPAGNVVSSVNWLIDGKSVCNQAFTAPKSAGVSVASAAASTVTCQINTTTLTAPLNTNGAHQLSATLVGPNGTITATSSQTLIFNNTNSVAVSLVADTSAFDQNGIIWYGKNLTATVTPTIFSGASVSRVIYTLFNVAGTPLAQFTDTVAPYVVTFAADTTRALPTGSVYATNASGQKITPLKGITDSVYVTVATVTSAGTTGPANGSSTLRVDNTAPRAVFFSEASIPQKFVNGSTKLFSFVDTTNAAGVVDNGVDRVSYAIQAGPAFDTLTATYGKTDAVGTTLAEASATRYVAKIKICDALNNCRSQVLSSAGGVADTAKFGVDITAPYVVFGPANTVKDTAKFTNAATAAATNYQIAFADTGAAPSLFTTSTPLVVTEVADTGAGNNICVSGTMTSSGTCPSKNTDSNVSVDYTAQQGYITLSAYVVDRAGNKSNVITRTILVDQVAPTADSVVVTTTPLAGGASETFRGYASDNFDVATITGQIQYQPFALSLGTVTVGSFGRDVFTKQASADFTNDFFIRALRPLGMGYQVPSAFNLSAKDVAGNASAVNAVAGVFAGLTAPSTDPFISTNDAAVTKADSSDAVISAFLKVQGSTTVNPAAQARAYQVNPATGVATLVGVSSTPITTVDNTYNFATFTYTFTPTTTLIPGRAIYVVFLTSGGVGMYPLGVNVVP